MQYPARTHVQAPTGLTCQIKKDRIQADRRMNEMEYHPAIEVVHEATEKSRVNSHEWRDGRRPRGPRRPRPRHPMPMMADADAEKPFWVR
eukprot:scaffold88451_cov50-Attheya_sp.AAC.3